MKKITGINIYYDEKGHCYYYDRFTKISYLIKEKNFKDYSMYANRYILAIGVVVIAEMFVKNTLLSLAAGIIFLVGMEYMFRTKFLARLTQVANVDAKAKVSYLEQIAQTDKGRVISKMIAYLAIAALLVLLNIQEGYQGFYMISIYVMAVFAAAMGIINCLALFKMKGNK